MRKEFLSVAGVELNLKEAIRKAEKNPEVKSKKKDGFYLTSALTIIDNLGVKIDKWILVYFNRETKKVFSVTVNGNDEMELSKISDPVIVSDYKELDVKNILPFERIKPLVERECEEKSVSSLLITAKESMWEVDIMDNMLGVIRVKIDGKTGKLIGRESAKLFR